MSSVVASVLIILIVVVGVSLLWAFVIPMVADVGLDEADVELTIIEVDGYTVYDSSNGLASVQIERGEDEAEILGIDVLFEINGTSVSAFIYQSEVLEPSSIKLYKFNLSEDGKPDKVSVSPVFEMDDAGTGLGNVIKSLPITGNAVFATANIRAGTVALSPGDVVFSSSVKYYPSIVRTGYENVRFVGGDRCLADFYIDACFYSGFGGDMAYINNHRAERRMVGAVNCPSGIGVKYMSTLNVENGRRSNYYFRTFASCSGDDYCIDERMRSYEVNCAGLDPEPQRLLGDINGDCIVDIVDYRIFRDNLGAGANNWSEGDLNGDGVVNLHDFAILRGNLGAFCEGVCIDSDEGQNYFVKGAIRGDIPVNWSGPSDVCLGNITLRETFCEVNDTNGDGYWGSAFLYACPNGCFDGACVELSETREEFRVYFDDSQDLWDDTDLTSTAQTQDAPVMVIESVAGVKDAIRVAPNFQKTSKMYLRWAINGSETQGWAKWAPSLEVFYSDVNGEVSESIRPRYATAYVGSNGNLSSVNITSSIGYLIIGNATINIRAEVVFGNLIVTFSIGGNTFSVDAGGDPLGNVGGSLLWFGGDSVYSDKEDARAYDLVVNGVPSGMEDDDIEIDGGWITIKTPEGNLDKDEVVFSVAGGDAGCVVDSDCGESFETGYCNNSVVACRDETSYTCSSGSCQSSTTSFCFPCGGMHDTGSNCVGDGVCA